MTRTDTRTDTTDTATDTAALRARVTGTVHAGDDPGARADLAGFQTGVVHRPDLVVGAADADDVAAAVAFAARRGLPVGVQATGHGQGVAADRGVVVSTRRLDGVAVDPVARVARVGAGATWGRVVDAAAEHGLAPPSGSSPGVGAVGYTVAGGFGLLGRELGYASDHVRALEVVTADGRRRRVDAEHDPDLFAALRGGRDAVGIVTAMEIGLTPLDTVLGGGLFVDAEHVDAVAAVVAAATADAPDALTVMLGSVPVPDLPAVPEPLRGRHVVHVRIVTTTARAAARDVVARLRTAAPVLAGDVVEMPWTASGSIVGEPDHAHAYDGTNVLTGDVEAATLAELVRRAGRAAVLDVRPLGGAFAAAPPAPDTVPFRGAGHVVRVLSGVDGLDDAARDAVAAHHDHVLDALPGERLGRAAGFLYGRARARAAADELHDAATRSVLADVVRRRDPHGTFRWSGVGRPA